jgi:superfamily I DNA and/or RNA helicase
LRSWKSFANQFGGGGVDLAIIDEAAHATLTQSLIPMGRARRVVLIGDEMQLPPAAPMDLARDCRKNCAACSPDLAGGETGGHLRFKPPMADCWLERSAFEWLSETRGHLPRVMLDMQFRMHPDIADFVGDVFYDGKLKNGVSREQRRLEFGEFTKAVCLISTSNYGKARFEEQCGTSFRNALEAELVMRVLRHAEEALGERAEFGVVTPYGEQRNLILNELRENPAKFDRVAIGRSDVASVDSFQGSERDVMIATFVRSPKICPRCQGKGTKKEGECERCRGKGILSSKLGWVHDLRRLNVAFSRARKMLILIGDIDALTNPRYGTGEGSEVLERFRNHVLDRGKVLQLWEESYE